MPSMQAGPTPARPGGFFRIATSWYSPSTGRSKPTPANSGRLQGPVAATTIGAATSPRSVDNPRHAPALDAKRRHARLRPVRRRPSRARARGSRSRRRRRRRSPEPGSQAAYGNVVHVPVRARSRRARARSTTRASTPCSRCIATFFSSRGSSASGTIRTKPVCAEVPVAPDVVPPARGRSRGS